MSTTAPSPDDPVKVPPPSHFAERADQGDSEWIEDAIEAYLGLTLGPKQREICRSVVTHEQTAVVGANGTGKTYITGAIALVWQTIRYPAITFGTSGTGKKLYRTLCRPIDKLHGSALGGAGLPGKFKRQPPRIDYDDPEHYFEAATPTDTGELEGAHSAYTLAIIEETDKDDVTADTVDAMRSLIPEWETSRMLAVGNPPRDEANVFADIIDERSSWHVIRVSSFDSYNVLVETGAAEGETIDGMATLSALRKDWEDYHDESWPGVEQARAWSTPEHEAFREDLDERWYRRRAGIIPTAGAAKNRPFTLSLVNGAYDPDGVTGTGPRRGTGIDVARSSDRTVQIDERDMVLDVAYAEPGTDHTVQFNAMWDLLDADPDAPIAVDAVGEGSGKADDTVARFPDVERFKNGANAAQTTEYKDRWTEGLCELGNWFEAGGTFADTELRKELQIAARVVTLSEKYYASRDDEVYVATPKDKIKEELGRSPDHLDAAIMAVLMAKELRADEPEEKPSPVFGRGPR